MINRQKLLSWLIVIILFAGVAYASVFFEKNSPINSTPKNILSGNAYASDGDSLKMQNIRIRMLGIDAPELSQICIDKNEKEWKCGIVAHKRLRQLIAGKQVVCSGNEYDRYDRFLAKCEVNGEDLGAVLVKEGLAVGYYKNEDYRREEASAKRKKLGMWVGEFERPKDWRAKNRTR